LNDEPPEDLKLDEPDDLEPHPPGDDEEPPDVRGAYLGAGAAGGAAAGRAGSGGSAAGARKVVPVGVGSGVPVAGTPNPPRLTDDEPGRVATGSDGTRTDEARTPAGGEVGKRPRSMCKVDTRAGRVLT
jgi:hypothetical protein